ncbi:hypothetical protein MYP_1898 [Sporocytophaga myxococcoides]|uniref:Uncharacterized protein n=1 Tax=Sporocytophaga myxococcoides TaxID=153721 RepID=A0A098LCG4_9BACT|nr:hypothetical protein MYP_1898 [Sporocytophaga myxococcoides]
MNITFRYGINISLKQVIKPIMKNRTMRELRAVPYFWLLSRLAEDIFPDGALIAIWKFVFVIC